MKSISSFIVATAFASISCLAQSNSSNSSYVEATAIVLLPQNISAFECWQFTDPVSIDNNKGTSGSQVFVFPNTSYAKYTVFPAEYDVGSTIPHNPPAAQLVTQLSGLAHVTLPVPVYGNKSLDEAWIKGGAHGLFLALDPTGSGHITTWPGDEETVTIQIPFASVDDIPAHEVISKGPCPRHRGGSQIVTPP